MEKTSKTMTQFLAKQTLTTSPFYIQRKNLVSTHLNQVNSIAVFQGFVYWLDDKIGVEKISITGEMRRPELQRLPHITDIVAVMTPDAKLIRNHTCSSGRTKCSHICIASASAFDNNSNEICSCPKGLMLMQDKRNCGAIPVCGVDHFTCSASYTAESSLLSSTTLNGGSEMNRDCIPVTWRCDGQNDCPDKSVRNKKQFSIFMFSFFFFNYCLVSSFNFYRTNIIVRIRHAVMISLGVNLVNVLISHWYAMVPPTVVTDTMNQIVANSLTIFSVLAIKFVYPQNQCVMVSKQCQIW
jgi:hypothetical protein